MKTSEWIILGVMFTVAILGFMWSAPKDSPPPTYESNHPIPSKVLNKPEEEMATTNFTTVIR